MVVVVVVVCVFRDKLLQILSIVHNCVLGASELLPHCRLVVGGVVCKLMFCLVSADPCV